MTDEPNGYLPEEIERGEDRAWHIPLWGCLATMGFMLLLLFCVWASYSPTVD